LDLEDHPIEKEVEAYLGIDCFTIPYPLHHKTCNPGASAWRVLSLKESLEGTGHTSLGALSLVEGHEVFLPSVKGSFGV
jgi:hypothetical protein